MIVFRPRYVKTFDLQNKRLVLASSSRYRRELLARLGLAFDTANPAIDESPLAGERPHETAKRLAEAKARTGAARHPDALIIGCDQVAVLEGNIVGKPGNHDTAVAQLRRASGKEMVFYTALCLLDTAANRAQAETAVVSVKFRDLSGADIENYLRKEQPYDCAGSAKCEGLGVALLEYIRGDDPNALIGLPLIALVSMLRNAGIGVLGTTALP